MIASVLLAALAPAVFTFSTLAGIAVDGAGIVYVADTGNRSIRRITSDGTVTTMTLSGSSLSEPRSLTVDAAGVIADTGSHTLRSIAVTGTISTLAGALSTPGTTDATGAAARFYSPFGVAVDTAGMVYVADSFNHTVRKIAAGGVVTTLAGTAGSAGSANGSGPAARFFNPKGIAADGAGRIDIADRSNRVIRVGEP